MLPDEQGAAPSYATAAVDLSDGSLVAVASGRATGGAALLLGCGDVVLSVARVPAGRSVVLPEAPRVHLHVATGLLDLPPVGVLHAGDAARLVEEPPHRATARTDVELLVWELA